MTTSLHSKLKQELTPQLNINDFDDHILESIFEYLPSNDLIDNCSLVCKRWRRVVNSKFFWIRKCSLKCVFTAQQIDFFHSHTIGVLFKRNHLKNPCGKKQLNFWCKWPKNKGYELTHLLKLNLNNVNEAKKLREIVESYKYEYAEPDNKWLIGKTRNFSLTQSTKFPSLSDESLLGFFSTRCNMKMQVIDLMNEIYLIEPLIGSVKLKLEVSEYFTTDAIYCLEVILVSSDYKRVDAYSKLYYGIQPKWTKVKHTFNVAKPFRYIIYYHAGVAKYDSNKYAMNVKITNGSVRFILE